MLWKVYRAYGVSYAAKGDRTPFKVGPWKDVPPVFAYGSFIRHAGIVCSLV